jgi:hypothetical protein
MIIWNIPKTITQGDQFTWIETKENYNYLADNLKIFIRGKSALDLQSANLYNGWGFEITSAQSMALLPGKYKAQIVVFPYNDDRFTLDIVDLEVKASFENLTELDTVSPDEKELELITMAIARLVSGAVAEYRIGDRMMRYQDLEQLTKRQRELRNRIAAKKSGNYGGRNVGIRFEDE